MALLCQLMLIALWALQTGTPLQAQPADWVVRGGGSWVYGNRILRQTSNAVGGPKKYVIPEWSPNQITALVRVDGFPHAESRIGVALHTRPQSGDGYSFVLRPGNQVGFLADGQSWGTSCNYNWAYGNWYWMKFESNGGAGTSLTGKIWKDSETEDQATVCTQIGWTYFTGGEGGLNGGSYGETASFDNVSVHTFTETFSLNGPPEPAAPPTAFLTSGSFVTQVQARATALNFDLGGFTDIMQATAQRVVCPNNPSVCQNYAPGTFAVVPSPFYAGGTWMRDSAWTLGALNNVQQMSSLVSLFAAKGAGTSGRIPTLIYNQGDPWYGAGGQGNPLPDDDSNMMYAIAARLGWQTASSHSYLNNVYDWLRSHADGFGNYYMTSHGWHDSFYPIGTSGSGSMTVSANTQGLFAVALRALKDLGVNVPQSEIDNANARYADLTFNGRLSAYRNSDIIDVSSLEGEAMSLFIWNEPILSDDVVRNTIASFTEVFDANQNFVGFKVASNADGSFLPPQMFPVENGGAGVVGGDYQNGASWMLYDALALYAGARHNIPSMRATYVDRLVRRMVAELRAGVGTTPANKSQEFLCTAPGLPGDSCAPTGSAVPERSDYGWNAFIVRLLANESAAGTSMNCPGSSCAATASPASLRFAAVKSGASGALTSKTPAQTVTLQFTGTPGPWTATTSVTWLELTNASANGSGQLSVAIANPANVIGGSTQLTATVTIRLTASGTVAAVIPITLTVNQSGVSASGPVGQLDTPAQNTTGVVGAIGVTGWVVDDIGVSYVFVYRGCYLDDVQANCRSDVVPGTSVVFIGPAGFVSGARPDVEAAFPNHPASQQAGFGLSVLTNMLPRTEGPFAEYGGQGPLTFYVVATDVEGNKRLLGRAYTDAAPAPTNITMANDTIAKPFGAIDTPSQGGVVSGVFNNFGWALTPDSNVTADSGDVFIPTSGSTMTVFIDGFPVATVAYNQCRGNVGNPVPPAAFCNDDVANIFGNTTPQPALQTRTSNPTRFRNLDAGRAVIGAYSFNTASLTNGLHTIAWSVTDSAGRNEGIGSRFFTVLNSGADQVVTATGKKQ